MARFSIACVLRDSPEYDAEYVERLHAGVARHLPDVPFVCLSDVDVPCERIPLRHEWPGWWSKLELFAPWVEGNLLYFDLDTIIYGDLTDIASVDRLTLLSDFHAPKNCASGMMFLPEADRAAAWEAWIRDPPAHMALAGGLGDGGFIDTLWNGRAARWQQVLPGQVVSYKAHVRKSTHAMYSGNGTVPDGVRVICFHGRPRPREIGWTV